MTPWGWGGLVVNSEKKKQRSIALGRGVESSGAFRITPCGCCTRRCSRRPRVVGLALPPKVKHEQEKIFTTRQSLTAKSDAEGL